MNLLRQYVRNQLLAERRGKNAAPPKRDLTGKDYSGKIRKKAQSLKKSGLGVKIVTFKGSNKFDVAYVDAKTGIDYDFTTMGYDLDYGSIADIMPTSGKDGPCGGEAYKIGYSEAPSGWGPLLYDVALEYIESIGGSGLISDRRSVSDKAVPVWDIYYEARPDIISRQLNDEKGQPNPKKKKLKCNQKTSRSDAQRRPEIRTWMDSPLSKIYNTGPGHFNAFEYLKKQGLIFYDVE